MEERPDIAHERVRHRWEAGYGIVETMFALAILTVAFLAHASLTVTGKAHNRLNEEKRLALEALRAQLEILRNFDFHTCFAAFDEATINDPPGARGPHFDIEGLSSSPSDADGRVGRIVFPTAVPDEGGAPVLREDVADPRLMMSADLDGDGLIDAFAKDTAYVHLPVLVEARWRGSAGDARVTLATWLTPRR
ncbi:MAG: hypothetical protein AB1486_22495 [Planctomycetota bacterium]